MNEDNETDKSQEKADRTRVQRTCRMKLKEMGVFLKIYLLFLCKLRCFSRKRKLRSMDCFVGKLYTIFII